jgi:hypothetical protein
MYIRVKEKEKQDEKDELENFFCLDLTWLGILFIHSKYGFFFLLY